METIHYLGLDLGSTTPHALIVDRSGRAVGFGESGAANHESVGYDGMFEAMNQAMHQALSESGLTRDGIAGAGFGVAGYDWASEREITRSTIQRLGLNAPFKFVNDAVLGIVAGTEEGWGIAIVSGTGCNCRGLDREHAREGRVTGHGLLLGE
ncbi:MAG: ATPase, partial [Chloroflexi bacterium]|nr:ATPase [Chloroflexota bacterium]